MQSEWYETFFTELALDFWRAAVPGESTSAEVDFLTQKLNVTPPSRLLDLPCGFGRHAIALASRGYSVTGIDISEPAISAAQREVGADPLPVRFLTGDMRHEPPDGPYDGAYCFGNSFGYLSHEDMRQFVRNLFHALRPGGRWIIDTGAAAESLLPHLIEERTLDAGGITYSVRNRYDAVAGRLLQSCTLRRGDEHQVAEISYAVYSVAQLEQLVQSAGWKIVGTYGALDSRPFQPGDRRLLLVAERPKSVAQSFPAIPPRRS